ncbi:OmpA family protein [Lacinutrix salivirga]
MKNYLKLLLVVLVFNYTNANTGTLEHSTTLKDRNSNIMTYDVYFGKNESTISKAQLAGLNAFIKTVEKTHFKKIKINGYSDHVGNTSYNLKLSNLRANSVKNIVLKNTSLGLSELEVKGFGEYDCFSKNTQKEEDLVNYRKVVIEVILPTLFESTFNENALEDDFEVNLEAVKFVKGTTTLLPESKAYLNEMADYFSKRKEIFFVIKSDLNHEKNSKVSINKSKQELALSKQRAKLIRNYLVKRGVDPTRVNYLSSKKVKNTNKNVSIEKPIALKVKHIAIN